MRRTIELDETQASRLEQLASAQRRTVDELVRQVIDEYISRRETVENTWRTQLAAIVVSFRQGVPPDLTPEQIEADITEARAEYRAARTIQGAEPGQGASDADRH